MSAFKLTGSDNTEYDLDTQGGVSAGGTRIGTWTTNTNNEIIDLKNTRFFNDHF